MVCGNPPKDGADKIVSIGMVEKGKKRKNAARAKLKHIRTYDCN